MILTMIRLSRRGGFVEHRIAKAVGFISENAQKLMVMARFSIVFLIVILGFLYLCFAWGKYHDIAKSEALQLARSVESLLHVEHISTLTLEEQPQTISDYSLIERSLVRLVENTDSIYHAFILKKERDDVVALIDSAAAYPDFPTIVISIEETAEINRLPFDTGQSVLTEPISTSYGKWIRALVPIYDLNNEHVVAVLGLSYSADEWQANVWKKMIPEIIIVVCLMILVCILLNLRQKHEMLEESERSKSVFLAHIPGLAYRCKYDNDWTMEFVSEGCQILTGYEPSSLLYNKEVSYNDIILPEYREILRDEWHRVVLRHADFYGEYEIITKSGQRKWVIELGQGIYDAKGNVEALEGIILDISEQKKKELQITYLQEHDFLTGLYNRSYMEQEKKRLDQPQFLPLSIAICDIDGLRMINSAYSHAEGDRLITEMAKLIQGCLGQDHVLGHAGGGEFILLMPNTDSQTAQQLTIDIKNRTESYHRTNKSAFYAASLSIGLSTKEKEEQPIEDVLKTAEEYLRNNKLLNQNSSHSAIVFSIMATLYAKSQETEEHGQRLGFLCKMIGEHMGLEQKGLNDLQLLSKLHDIGKIGIEDHILNKPDKLTEEEWAKMKKHPEIGCQIVMATPQLEHLAEYILNHHERWDGKGYPNGLSGEEIPLIARILAVADAYDAMTENRVYRPALSPEDAIKEIEQNAGTQFDPYIAQLFVDLIRKRESI